MISWYQLSASLHSYFSSSSFLSNLTTCQITYEKNLFHYQKNNIQLQNEDYIEEV